MKHPVRNRPVILVLTSQWRALPGPGFILTALISWLFVLPLQIRGHAENPYIGIVAFMIIPAVFFAGLALGALGIVLGKRRVEKLLDQHHADGHVQSEGREHALLGRAAELHMTFERAAVQVWRRPPRTSGKQ